MNHVIYTCVYTHVVILNDLDYELSLLAKVLAKQAQSMNQCFILLLSISQYVLTQIVTQNEVANEFTKKKLQALNMGVRGTFMNRNITLKTVIYSTTMLQFLPFCFLLGLVNDSIHLQLTGYSICLN